MSNLDKTTRLLQSIAQAIDSTLNAGKSGTDRKVAFVLLTYNSGAPGQGNYVSNADRKEMLVAMKEMLARMEGQAEQVGHA